MDDRARIWTGALAGAVVGAALGYLYLTDRGRRVREELEPTIEQLAAEIDRTRVAATRARRAASESWEAVRRVEAGRGRRAGYPAADAS